MKEQFAKPAVSALIEKVENGERYLVIQERRKSEGEKENGLLEVPGGKIREYENIFDALRREVKEETGLSVVRIHSEEKAMRRVVDGNELITFTPLCSTQNLSGAYSLIEHFFVCEAEGELLEATDESCNLRWEKAETVRAMLEENPGQFFLTDILPLEAYFKALEDNKPAES
jgi:8-oxo-dGTP diphosphatase